MLLADKFFRMTPAINFDLVLIGFSAWTMVARDPIKRIAFALYGDSTPTGRTDLLDLINNQISRKPWTEWGLHSDWLVSNSPQSEASGSIRDMPEIALEHGLLYIPRLGMVCGAMSRARRTEFEVRTCCQCGDAASRAWPFETRSNAP